MKKARKTREEFICPVCGETVPAGSLSCPGCGADENTGWSEDTIYDSTGIEDPDDFDYEETIRREVCGLPRKRTAGGWVIGVVAIGLVLLIVWYLIRGAW